MVLICQLHQSQNKQSHNYVIRSLAITTQCNGNGVLCYVEVILLSQGSGICISLREIFEKSERKTLDLGAFSHRKWWYFTLCTVPKYNVNELSIYARKSGGQKALLDPAVEKVWVNWTPWPRASAVYGWFVTHMLVHVMVDLHTNYDVSCFTHSRCNSTPCFLKSRPLCFLAITFSNIDRFEWSLHQCIR